MFKSDSDMIRLRRIYDPPTPSQHQDIKVLKNKLPLILNLKKGNIFENRWFKFHYKSAEKLLDDFEHYLRCFKSLKETTSKQYMNDVKHIWVCVDPNLSLHPNHLVEPEHIESRFFMPEKQKLQENKDGSPSKQTRHLGRHHKKQTIKFKAFC